MSALTRTTNPLRRVVLLHSRTLTTTRPHLSNVPSTYRNPSLDPLYRPDFPENLPIPRSALAALGARLELNLSEGAGVEDKVLVCLTDRSWDENKVKSVRRPTSSSLSSVEEDTTVVESSSTSATIASSSASPNNQLLSSLGNSLLGLFTSEHLSTLYPNLPTRVLKSSVSAYCGPSACASVGRELGVGVNVSSSEGSGRTKFGKSEGLRVRWVRGGGDGGKGQRGWEVVVADSVRALVGLVYQERVRSSLPSSTFRGRSSVLILIRHLTSFHLVSFVPSHLPITSRTIIFNGRLYYQGMNAARQFVHNQFLTRHVDVASMLNFRNPKHVLGVEMRRLGLGAGIESR